MTKNDEAWEKLFEKYNILEKIDENGYCEIRSSEINEFRESRLMAKFDYKKQLPKIFDDNDLSILPISRSKYIISKFDVYHTLEEREKEIINNHVFPYYIESINYNDIKSEAQVLNCAFFTGIIEDFLGEEVDPTVSGRMSSGLFKFKIKTLSSKILDISVENSQIEIDGAYEGLNSLALFEAKLEFPETFLVRQLYFPFKTWKNRLSKDIRTIFLVYSNGIFSLYEYSFENQDCYNSINLIKQKNYSIMDGDIQTEDIDAIVNSVDIVKEPEIAFPQADVFERVINLCEILKENKLNIEQIKNLYAFDIRQAHYYIAAGRYLGLIEKDEDENFFKLTERGDKIFKLNLKDRQLKLTKCILEHEAFFRTYNFWVNKRSVPSKDEIVDIMKKSKVYNIDSPETYRRRSSSVIRWVEWILDLRNY